MKATGFAGGLFTNSILFSSPDDFATTESTGRAGGF
jgi:hypothetical protein